MKSKRKVTVKNLFPSLQSPIALSMGSSLKRSSRFMTMMMTTTPHVWVETAEEGFVDEDENLEDGEICLASFKAFATASSPPCKELSSSSSNDSQLLVASSDLLIEESMMQDEQNDKLEMENRRFLCAGALVQRAVDNDDIDIDSIVTKESTGGQKNVICDAWTADAILEDGGPNLQLQGALKVLDELFLYHLRHHSQQQQQQQQQVSTNQVTTVKHNNDENSNNDSNNNPSIESNSTDSILALRTFIVQQSDDDQSNRYKCASYMACQMRGFRPLKEMVRRNYSIYTRQFYDCYHYHSEMALDGMVFDYSIGKERYIQEKIRLQDEQTKDDAALKTIQNILDLLPDSETVQRYTVKRYSVGSDS